VASHTKPTGELEPGTEVTGEASKQQPPVRWSVVVMTTVLAVPGIYAYSLIMDRPASRVDRSFNGDDPINVTLDGVAIKGYDVVAYFLEEKAVKGRKRYVAEFQGATFRFRSPQNRDRFLAGPEAYVPAYGGYCALGIANGYKDDMHPEAFDIVDGRLYFNLTPSIAEGWRTRKHDHIAHADENWPRLQNAPGYGWGDAR